MAAASMHGRRTRRPDRRVAVIRKPRISGLLQNRKEMVLMKNLLNAKLAMLALATTVTAGGAVVLGAGPAMADHGITTTANVNLRTGPGTQYPSIGTVP